MRFVGAAVNREIRLIHRVIYYSALSSRCKYHRPPEHLRYKPTVSTNSHSVLCYIYISFEAVNFKWICVR
jgi:hypothetical protein